MLIVQKLMLYKQDPIVPLSHFIQVEIDELNDCLLNLEAQEKRWDSVGQITPKRKKRGSRGEGFLAQ